jgi:Caspase domain
MKSALMLSSRFPAPITRTWIGTASLVSAVLIGFSPITGFAQAKKESFAEVFAKMQADRTSTLEVAPGKVKMFDELVASASTGKTNETATLAKRFLDDVSYAEPRQRLFAELLLKIMGGQPGVVGSGNLAATDPQQVQLTREKATAETTLASIRTSRDSLDAQIDQLVKKTTAPETPGKKVGNILRNILSGGTKVNGTPIGELLPDDRKKLEELRASREKLGNDLAAIQGRIQKIADELDGLAKQAGEASANATTALRDEVIVTVEGMNRDGYPQLSQAAASYFTWVRGSDAAVNQANEKALELVKKLPVARNLADPIRETLEVRIRERRPWQAITEFEDTKKRLEELLGQDEELAALVALQLGDKLRTVERMLSDFKAVRESFFKRADVTPRVVEDFERWVKEHPDYPGTEVENDRTELIKLSLKRDLEALDAIVKARPIEAWKRCKEMLDRMDSRTKTIFETRLLAILDQSAGVGLEGLQKRWDENIQKVLSDARLMLSEDAAKKDIRITECKRETQAIRLEAQAWMENPLDAITKSKFQQFALNVDEADQALERWRQDKGFLGGGLLVKLGLPAVLVGGLSIGWFLVGRRKVLGSCDPAIPPPQVTMLRYALLLAADRYQDRSIQSLRFAERDARLLDGFLRESARFDRVEELYGERLDRAAALDLAEELAKDLAARGGGVLLLFYAGHGFTHLGKHCLLCPKARLRDLDEYDHALTVDRLRRVTDAPGVDRQFVIDACRTILRAGERDGLGGYRAEGLRDLAGLPRTASTVGGFSVLASCDEGEQATELESLKHGVFAIAWLEELRRAQREGLELRVDDTLVARLRERVATLANEHGLDRIQRPWRHGNSDPVVLIPGRPTPEPAPPAASVPVGSLPAGPGRIPSG